MSFYLTFFNVSCRRLYKGQIFCTTDSVKMIRVNLLVLICMFLLSLVGESRQQSDSCTYEGQRVVGEFTIPGICLLYRCIPGQGVTAIGCGIRIPPEGCYIQHPESKNYPDCCNTGVVCPGVNSVNSDQSSGIFDNQNLGYSKQGFGLQPAPFTSSTKSGYSTEGPLLTPPSSVTVNFRPKSQQKKRPTNNEHQNSQRDFENTPYYYKK